MLEVKQQHQQQATVNKQNYAGNPQTFTSLNSWRGGSRLLPGVLNLPTDSHPCLFAVGDCVLVQLSPDSEPEVSFTQRFKSTPVIRAEVQEQCELPLPAAACSQQSVEVTATAPATHPRNRPAAACCRCSISNTRSLHRAGRMLLALSGNNCAAVHCPCQLQAADGCSRWHNTLHGSGQ